MLCFFQWPLMVLQPIILCDPQKKQSFVLTSVEIQKTAKQLTGCLSPETQLCILKSQTIFKILKARKSRQIFILNMMSSLKLVRAMSQLTLIDLGTLCATYCKYSPAPNSRCSNEINGHHLGNRLVLIVHLQTASPPRQLGQFQFPRYPKCGMSREKKKNWTDGKISKPSTAQHEANVYKPFMPLHTDATMYFFGDTGHSPKRHHI